MMKRSRKINFELLDGELEQLRALSLPLFWRARAQILMMLSSLLAVVILPLFFGLTIYDAKWQSLWQSQTQVSLAFAAGASVVGLMLLRELVQHPGLSISAYVMPTIILTYSAIILTMFFFRFDYSRYVIATSFSATVCWLQYMFYLESRQQRPLLAIIPIGQATVVQKLEGVRWLTLSDTKMLKQGITGVVADLNADLAPNWERFIAQCALASIPVYDIKTIVERLTGKSDVSHLSETVFGSVLPSRAYLRIKRSIDFVAALVLLPIFLPVIIFSALLVKMDSPGPAFFFQQRLGYRAQTFKICKLRSMKVGPDQIGGQFTVNSDPRITRFGRIIRTYRIDELPQIFNVLKGEMSWIGPRPEALELAEWYAREIPFYVYRQTVRPGITGWAQVNQGNVAELDATTDKLHYDFYYIKHFSPVLDVLIVLRTIQTIFTGFGSK
jgi:lipopolysaccharide/colanic/teichoic acid biosynthesis glycosyltransferase